MRKETPSYGTMREFLDTIDVIETHEHYVGEIKPVTDVLGFIVSNYFMSDLHSAAYACESDAEAITDTSISFDKRYEIFEALYEKTRHTAYARGLRLGLQQCWGIDDVDKDSLRLLGEKLSTRDASFYETVMEQYRIRAQIADVDMTPYVTDEQKKVSDRCRFAFSLPRYHNLHGIDDIRPMEKHIGRRIVCLDDYLEAFTIYLKKCRAYGAVCIKDQTAYRRDIAYDHPSRAQAEKIFHQMLINPREIFGDDRVRVLDDWLFGRFMRDAREYDIPVQIHTGHMAGIRNDIVKTNAVHLTKILELHGDVRFSLFHGNWPYLGEFLFLGKNYPNVWLDLCWVQSIDPLYSIELMKRAVMTVPHAKLMAFGGDTTAPEWAVGYLTMAKENVAVALSDLLDAKWLAWPQAKQLAADWFFNNPNEFFKLGFDRLEVV